MANETHLGVEKARRFFNLLAEEPFVCVVAMDEELRIFSSAMSDSELAFMRRELEEIALGGE